MLKRTTLALVLALLLSGCAMKAYEGPELPTSEIAELFKRHTHGYMVRSALLGLKHRTSIIEIDGRKIKWVWDFIHILPGQHTALVLYRRHSDVAPSLFRASLPINYETRDLSIDFTARAGQRYGILAERRGERNWIWVEDLKSGKVVAGEKPPDDKAKEKDPAMPPKQP